MAELNLDPEIVKKVCRIYFERYKKPADILDIVDYLNAEKIPPPPGNNSWDVFNIVPVIDLYPKICPEVAPAKGPEQGGSIILEIDDKTKTFEITDCSYGVSEDEFDVLEMYATTICVAVKIPKEPISIAVVEENNVSSLIGAELSIYEWSPSFGDPFVCISLPDKDKIIDGLLKVEQAKLFTDISKQYGGSDIFISGSIEIMCKSGKTYHGTFTVNTQFNW